MSSTAANGMITSPYKPITTNVPTSSNSGAGAVQQVINKYTGMGLGNALGMQNNNTVGYTGVNGEQMFTGDLSGNTAAMDYFAANPATAQGIGSSMLSGLGTAIGGIGGIGGVLEGYGSWQKAEAMHDANKQSKAAYERDAAARALEYNAGIDRYNAINQSITEKRQGLGEVNASYTDKKHMV